MEVQRFETKKAEFSPGLYSMGLTGFRAAPLFANFIVNALEAGASKIRVRTSHSRGSSSIAKTPGFSFVGIHFPF
jgi:hypothetical protein